MRLIFLGKSYQRVLRYLARTPVGTLVPEPLSQPASKLQYTHTLHVGVVLQDAQQSAGLFLMLYEPS